MELDHKNQPKEGQINKQELQNQGQQQIKHQQEKVLPLPEWPPEILQTIPETTINTSCYTRPIAGQFSNLLFSPYFNFTTVPTFPLV